MMFVGVVCVAVVFVVFVRGWRVAAASPLFSFFSFSFPVPLRRSFDWTELGRVADQPAAGCAFRESQLDALAAVLTIAALHCTRTATPAARCLTRRRRNPEHSVRLLRSAHSASLRAHCEPLCDGRLHQPHPFAAVIARHSQQRSSALHPSVWRISAASRSPPSPPLSDRLSAVSIRS